MYCIVSALVSLAHAVRTQHVAIFVFSWPERFALKFRLLLITYTAPIATAHTSTMEAKQHLNY